MTWTTIVAVVLSALLSASGAGADEVENSQAPLAGGEAGTSAVAETPEQLAERMRVYLAGLKKLRVESEQRVSYLRLENMPPEALPDGPPRDARKAMEMFADRVVSVDVRIVAEMTHDSYTVTMWRGDEERPISVVTLAPKDGVPYVTERQWYPVLNDYRELSRPSPHPYGYGEPAIQSCLFSSIDDRVCATAEFFTTWLGESAAGKWLDRIVARGKFVPDGEAEAAGYVRLHRPVYAGERMNGDGYSSCDQFFFVRSDPPLLQEWIDELAALRFDTSVFRYMLVERRYRYFTYDNEANEAPGTDSESLSEKEKPE
jgi:hypothetical protein